MWVAGAGALLCLLRSGAAVIVSALASGVRGAYCYEAVVRQEVHKLYLPRIHIFLLWLYGRSMP